MAPAHRHELPTIEKEPVVRAVDERFGITILGAARRPSDPVQTACIGNYTKLSFNIFCLIRRFFAGSCSRKSNDRQEQGPSAGHLYWTTLREDRLETPRVVSAGLVQEGIFAISDDEALISQRLHSWDKYEIRTDEFVDLPIDQCTAAAIRSRTREVA